MKKFTITLASIALFSGGIKAQAYCTVTTAIAYASTMPGVTGFTLNSITRNSAGLECSGACNSFVTTGMTTTLNLGQTYTVKMNHNQDVSIAPNMNLRVWIDFNKNGILNDAGETVMTIDNHAPGVYTGTFTVPGTATLGSTRMRITAKMPAAAGHNAPTPCDSPPDPLAYHGEIEDYTVVLASATGVNELSSSTISSSSIFPNPTTNNLTVSFGIKENTNVSVELFDITGKLVSSLMDNQNLKSDNYTMKYDLNSVAPAQGIYFVKISAGSSTSYHKVIKTN